MVKHRRLLEALGLLLVLVAWTLNWWNSDRWSGAAGDYLFHVESILDSYRATTLTSTVQIESAVTRAAAAGQPIPERTLGHYGMAWESPEARLRWAEHAQARLAYLRNSHENLRNTRAEYGLVLDKRLPVLSARLDSVGRALRGGCIREMVHGQELLVPDPAALSQCDATSLVRRMSYADAEWVWPLRYLTLSELRSRPRAISHRYLALFLAGSVLVGIAKFGDWRAGT